MVSRTIIFFALTLRLMSATDRFVATNGSNANPGTIGSPWLTFRFGVLNMNSGDTLNLREGTYPDDGFELDEFKSGTSSATPTIIRGYQSEHAIYKPLNAPAHGMDLIGKSNIWFINIDLDGTTCTSDAFKLTTGTYYITVTNCVIRDCFQGHGILLTPLSDSTEATGHLITHCSVMRNGRDKPSGSQPHQIYVQTSSNVIENCYLEGITNGVGGTYGIHSFASGLHDSIYRNNFVTNCNQGIGLVGSSTSNMYVFNNVIVGCPGFGVDVLNGTNVWVLNNTCYTNAGGIHCQNLTNGFVENNVCVGGYAAGSSGGIDINTCTTVSVKNNLSYGSYFGGNRTGDYRVLSSIGVTESSNLFAITQTSTNEIYDAKFANFPSDLKINVGSSAINAGRAQTVLTNDYLGFYRGHWDIGAHGWFGHKSIKGF